MITAASRTPPLVSSVEVHSSHQLSDHSVVICELSVRRLKPTAVRYPYRNIKGIDVAALESKLFTSTIILDPPDDPDKFVCQLEQELSIILNELAPIRYGSRPHGRKNARWLSEDAIQYPSEATKTAAGTSLEENQQRERQSGIQESVS